MEKSNSKVMSHHNPEYDPEGESNVTKDNLLMSSLVRFFQNTDHMNRFIDVIRGKTVISLRLLDWLITNYSKVHNIVYTVTINGEEKQFNMFLNYKTQLKAFSKKQFDPFQRRNRISFSVETEQYNDMIITTIGQLNFFRWAIQYNVLEYAEMHLTKIESDMTMKIQNRGNKVHKQKKWSNNTNTIIQMCGND